MKIDVVFLAAGKGTRAKLGLPKQLALLKGKPIMIHSLEIFNQMEEVNNIIVATIPGRLNEFKLIVQSYGINNVIFIEGGDTRQQSVNRCLSHVETERVIIHEATRPFINREFIQNLLTFPSSATVPVLDIPYTVVDIADPFGKYPIKKDIRNVQLPQVFDSHLIQKAHQYAIKHNQLHFTDDSILLSYYCRNVADMNFTIVYFPGIEENIKITAPIDIHIAESIFDHFHS